MTLFIMVVNGLTLSLGELKNKLLLAMCVFSTEFGGKCNINSPKDCSIGTKHPGMDIKPELNNSI